MAQCIGTINFVRRSSSKNEPNVISHVLFPLNKNPDKNPIPHAMNYSTDMPFHKTPKSQSNGQDGWRSNPAEKIAINQQLRRAQQENVIAVSGGQFNDLWSDADLVDGVDHMDDDASTGK